MTSIQPRLVRADTLDLQSYDAPSAKDHTRSPTYTTYNHNSAGSHLRQALRSAEESAYNDQKSSPRVSQDEAHLTMNGQTHLYDSADEDLEDEQHGGLHNNAQHDAEYENGDLEDEEDLDDDMLDKISSSPSIEDGKYPQSHSKFRLDFVQRGTAMAPTIQPNRGLPLSNTLSLCPAQEDIPYPLKKKRYSSASHHLGEYSSTLRIDTNEDLHKRQHQEPGNMALDSTSQEGSRMSRSYSQDSIGSLTKFLLPIDDPLLDQAFDNLDFDDPDSTENDHEDETNWVDEEVWYDEDSCTDDGTDDFPFTTDSRFIDSGWGGECLRETEDIDFDFVYALHTFVANVEGQANATKGDTMVLLDDSNSYWWLVRVVKDGSIGYLPAEHIETPTERLARLNKHRNIDLAASMLGDNPEKSKNPLKKAMRRRNAKTVAFTAPIYYEPSDYAYSSDEEEEDGEEMDRAASGQVQQTDQQATAEITVADDMSSDGQNGIRKNTNDDRTAVAPSSPIKSEAPETETQVQQDENFQRTRNGVVRNTDSFFKDDTAETKKISLTPRLLRGDSENSVTTEQQQQPMSTETFDKLLGEDKGKEEKKKKEKKGMLSGLFKRKDKKSGKNEPEEIQSPEDPLLSPVSKTSMDSISNGHQSPERRPSKLHKAPPSVAAPKPSPTDAKFSSKNSSTVNSPTSTTSPGSTISPQDATIQAAISSPAVQSNGGDNATDNAVSRHAIGEKKSIFGPITTVLKSGPPVSEAEQPVKAVYSKRAKERFAIDASDSDEEPNTVGMQVPAPTRHSISPMLDTDLPKSRPDSAMQVSPINSIDEQHDQAFHSNHKTNPFEDEAVTPTDTHGQSDTASTSKPSPSLATHTPSTSRSTPTWSDASLRTYMDDDQDIRDLLIIVHDKTNVTPVGPDHPLMGGLFTTERTRLAEMQTQLDSMLTTWISRKNPGLLAK